MRYRQLGVSGVRVSVLTMATMTFGGGWVRQRGSTGVQEARRRVDRCLEAGVNLIDTANVYCVGRAEEIVGQVLEGRRDQVLVATRARMPMGDGPNDEAEYELVPSSVDQGLGMLVWSPLAGGLLSGRYRRGQQGPQGSRLLSGWDEPPVGDQDKLQDLVEVLVEVAKERGASPAQLALAWHQAKTAADRLGPADRLLLDPHLAG